MKDSECLSPVSILWSGEQGEVFLGNSIPTLLTYETFFNNGDEVLMNTTPEWLSAKCSNVAYVTTFT